MPRSVLTCRDSKISPQRVSQDLRGLVGWRARDREAFHHRAVVAGIFRHVDEVLAGRVLHVDHVMEVYPGNRMMVTVPPSAACPPYRHGITWRVVGLAGQAGEPPGPLDEDVAAGR